MRRLLPAALLFTPFALVGCGGEMAPTPEPTPAPVAAPGAPGGAMETIPPPVTPDPVSAEPAPAPEKP